MIDIDGIFNYATQFQKRGDMFKAARYYKTILEIEQNHEPSKINLKYISHITLNAMRTDAASGNFDRALGHAILIFAIGGEFVTHVLSDLRNFPEEHRPQALITMITESITKTAATAEELIATLRRLTSEEIDRTQIERAISLLPPSPSLALILDMLDLCHTGASDLIPVVLGKAPDIQDARLHVYRGQEHDSARRIGAARRDYREALKMDPDHFSAMYNLARLIPHTEEGRTLALKLVPSSIGDKDSRRSIIRRLIQIGLVGKAIELMTSHEEDDPDFRIYLRLYQFLFDRIKLDKFPLPVPVESAPTLANLVVWGRDYIEMFLEVSLPSLLQPGNLPAMAADRPLVIEIVTNQAGVAIFEAAPIMARLKTVCAVSYIVIGEVLLKPQPIFGIGPNYIVFGLASHITALRARAAGGDVLFLLPDVVYAENSFRAVIARLKQGDIHGIMADGLNTNLEDMLPLLERHRSPDRTVLTVDHDNLAGYALANLHERTRCQIFITPDKCSSYPSRFIFGKEHGLSSRAFNIQPLLITNQALHHLTHPNYLTPDGAMTERIFNPRSGMKFHIFEDSSKFLFVELSSREARGADYARMDIPAREGILAWLVNYGFGETALLSFARPTRVKTSHPVSLPATDDETEAEFVRQVRVTIEEAGLYE